VANSAGGVSILLGDGSGAFLSHVEYATGNGAASVAVGDFNGDGRLDLAVANSTDGTISVLLGNGDGTFAAATNYNVAGADFSIAAGDFNSDGRIDLAVTSSTSNEVFILLGDGHGNFGMPVSYATGAGPRAVIVADLNSDGIPDLAVANNTDSTVSVLLGNGDVNGTFQAATSYSTAPSPVSLAAADFNGLGHLDLAVDGSTNVISILSQAPVASATSLAASPNPSSYGQPVTFTATATAGSGVLAGTVTFKDGAATIGTAAVVNGQASISLTSLSIGSHSVTAAYSGDTHGHGPSTSAAVSQTVNQQTTSTALTASAANTTYGQSLTLTATVVPQFAPATGSITFRSGSNSLGTVPLSGTSASFIVTTLVAGTHSLTASYSGDSKSIASTSPMVGLTVSKATSTTTVVSSLDPATVTQAITFTATVAPQIGGIPTGTITFKSGATVLGTGALTNGQAALTTSTLTIGTKSITASYGGDSNFTGSRSVVLSQVVTKATTATVVSASANPIMIGQPVTFTASVTSLIGAPPNGEMITFRDGAATLGTAPLSGGTASYTATKLAVGPHSVRAIYAADTNFAGSTSAVLTETVNRYATSVAISSNLNPSVFGWTLTFAVSVTPLTAGGTTPTGTVTIKNGTATLGSVTLSGGTTSFATSSLIAGTHAVTAVYGGDATNAGSTSAVLNQVVNKAATTTLLTSSLNPSALHHSATFTATVTSSGTPTGTVMFLSDGTSLGAKTLSGGKATLSTSALASGSHLITATYAGSANYVGSSATLTQVVH